MASPLESLKRVWTTYPTLRLLFFALGIVSCFFLYGVMQEKIMRFCYGGEFVDGKCNGQKFTFEMSLVLVYCTWYFLFAQFLMILNNRCACLHSVEKDTTPPLWYVCAAFCYISAMVCSNMALRHINYPTQLIAKSSKPIPVMILNMIIARKRYTLQKFLLVLLIVVGVILFVYKEGKAGASEESTYLGLALVGMSLLADGVLGGIEERMRKKTKPNALNLMSSLNLFSAGFLIAGVVATQECVEFYHFVNKYPELLLKMAMGAFVGSLGQIFIFLMVSSFGSLPTSIATTLRKFFNVLVSVIFFGNTLLARQWVATAIVFVALVVDALTGRKEVGKKNKDVPTGEERDVEKNAVELEELNAMKKEDEVKA